MLNCLSLIFWLLTSGFRFLLIAFALPPFAVITSHVKVLIGTLLTCFALLQAQAQEKVTPLPPKSTSSKGKTSPSKSAPPAQQVYPVALPNYDEQTATQLQIFLDNADFGPGKIDGRMGEFFRKALISYKHAHAMPKTGAVDKWLLDQVPVVYTTYAIKGDDLAFVGTIPAEHADQALLKYLPYTSLLEFVAERFHSSEDYIRKLNPGIKPDTLKVGDTLKVPRCSPFRDRERR